MVCMMLGDNIKWYCHGYVMTHDGIQCTLDFTPLFIMPPRLRPGEQR